MDRCELLSERLVGSDGSVGLSDADVWVHACSGRVEAFECLYDRHVDTVHRVLARRVGADAADLTAEVFLLAWANRDRIRPSADGSLLPWLLGTALNLARRHVQKGVSEAKLTRVLATRTEVVADPIDALIDAVDDQAALVRAHQALGLLSSADQEVLVLCLFEGLTASQAGRVLDQPATTVRSRLSRARGRLAAAYHRLLVPTPGREREDARL